MIAPLQLQARSHGSQTTSSSDTLGTRERRARPLAVNEPGDAHELEAERHDHAVGSDAPPVNGFSFSRVSVFGLQRKCACGSTGAPTGKCGECGKKRAFGLQPKLTVNQPGDAYEQEADRVAQAMMGSFSHPAEPKSEAGGELHHPAESDLTKGGERLPPDVAEFYETRFGRDFSGVRVHTGATAMRYNDAVNAYAFTYGSHIWLGPGLPQQPSHILAHELAHVVQQTQPPPFAATPNQPGLSPSPQGVQRFLPYWMPAGYRDVGTPTHRLVMPRIGQLNGIFTEAPVPNARTDEASSDVGYGKTGIADLYQASTTVGVFFNGHKLPKRLRSNRDLLHRGERFPHIENSAPQADESRKSVIRAGSAPTEILVGDLKPSHGTIEAQKGPKQVDDYLKGFELARSEVNKMDVGEGGFEQTDAKWPPLTTGIINIKVPEMFKEPIATGQDAQRLKLMHNGDEVELSREVMGKVYVRPSPDGGGIWNYIWAPTTRLTAADLPASVTRLGADVTTNIIRPLLASPVATAKKARPAPRPSRLTPSPRRVQTQKHAKVAEEVKDPFDKAAFDAWKADHSRLTGQEKQLEKTPDFKEAKFKSLVVEDRQAAIKSGFNLPAVSKEEETAAKTVDKIEFWTGASSAVFGRLRYWFGGAFVKVVNAYYSIRARFQNLLDKKGAPKSGGLLGTIIRIAFNILKVAGRILVERTAQHIVDSLKRGVEQKLKTLIPEDKIEAFEAKVKEIEALASDLERQAIEAVEALVCRTIGPYEKHIETIADVASKLGEVADVVSKVRWGARFIACLTPPGWGCLWILAESVIEKFASWLIDKCWFKKEIAPLVTGIDFIANLPKELAGFIIEGIKRFLPEKVHDVFADIDTSKINTQIAPHEVCNENDYPTTRGLSLLELEKLALAELRKEIGEEKWAAWTRLAELYGVNRGNFLTKEEIEQLKKELKKADLAAMKDAADLYQVLTPTGGEKAVVNLTKFLEEAEQKKQEMYGGGGPGGQGGGEGGKVGINVPASEKPLEGDYKLGFKFEVVAGVTSGQYAGRVIKVNIANSIKDTVVTLEDVEVFVKKRVFIPNERNPEKVEVHLEATKDQFFNIEEKHGAEVVKKIGVKRFRVGKGRKYQYMLPLKAG